MSHLAVETSLSVTSRVVQPPVSVAVEASGPAFTIAIAASHTTGTSTSMAALGRAGVRNLEKTQIKISE